MLLKREGQYRSSFASSINVEVAALQLSAASETSRCDHENIKACTIYLP
jgi:hypothetical protein